MHLKKHLMAPFIALALLALPARADVVINEIFYHAPDDLDNVQFIELYNTGAAAVDLSDWKLSKGVQFQFPTGVKIPAEGYLVICKNLREFKKYYGFDAGGQFIGSLDHNSDRIDLHNVAGKKIDSVKYKSRAPWPMAAAGYSASLERICPTSPGDAPENWAPSPMAPGTPKPAGTPGKKNVAYVDHLPPVISNVTFSPVHAGPDQEIKVEADVETSHGLRTIELCYRIAGSGFEKAETAVPMARMPSGTLVATIPAQKAGQIVRFRIKAVDDKGGQRFYPPEQELRPALSVYVHEKFAPGQTPFGLIVNVGDKEFRGGQQGRPPFGFGGPSPNPPPRGNSAFVFVDQKTGAPELFDFINVNPRSGGRRVRFHKDHTLQGMRTIVLIFEALDRWVLAEPLAYEVYRQAGNSACRTDFVRTWIDDRPIGYQLLIEVVNKSFFKHNDLRTDGNLYKCQWFGNGLIGQHEKKTNVHEGHRDLLTLVAELNKTKGDAQWEIIKKNFDVEQTINYFAVNTVLSHWDGFFNNYFTYHDVHGSGKWTMYPWDQDKTWGYHDAIQRYEVFFDMPLTFGMARDKPVSSIWWRPGGHFSSPLLANPQYRKLFLARTREIAETVYTEKNFFPLIETVGARLKEDVAIRAKLQGQDPKQAEEHLRRNLDSLREHLTKRRNFILAQEEIKTAGSFDRKAITETR